MTDVSTSAADGLLSAVRTDPGRTRVNNEDVPLVDALRGVYGVIDGVGGHAAGEVAAAIARDVILQRLGRRVGTPAERVREAIAIANNEIFRRAEESSELHGMACVITLAIVTDGLLTIGHVGDSRLYKVRAEGLRKLTHDHSPVGEREDAREITETEAMRHPRRNEVFRDVGSGYRDKDEDEFVEVIEEPFERDSAILLCTDGLTDMVPSALIERTVRQHAGSPQDIVDALVAAANDAGGKDNVTVVYAEAPEFARAVRGPRAGVLDDPGVVVRGSKTPPHTVPAADTAHAVATPRPGRIVRAGRGIARSRTTWFAVGALAGVIGALALVWRTDGANVAAARTLVVGGVETGAFARIEDAMAAASAGDVVRVEPGVYRERVMARDGVDLIARVPGSVTIARAADASGDVVGLTASGDLTARVSGVRLESTPELPMDIGIRVTGQGRTFDLIDIAGPMRAGLELLPEGAVTVQGSVLAVEGAAVVLGDRSQATFINNMFIRIGTSVEGPIAMPGSAQATLRRNVFAGYGADIIRGVSAAERQRMLAGNFVVGSQPSLAR